MPLSSRIKNALNLVLRRLGAELVSTRRAQLEQRRLQHAAERGHWASPPFDAGLHWETAAFRSFLTRVCLPYRDDYSRLARTQLEAGNGYFLENGWFESVDAEVLYSLIRHFQPAKIVEIGSGNSTRLMRRAITDGELRTELTCIDPSPRADIRDSCDRHLAQPVEDIRPETIAGMLRSGDFLFIDSSHVLKPAGDVALLYLEVLPRLAAGVLIHAHDIFLPFEYPQSMTSDWSQNGTCPWNEQYLVQALLLGGSVVELLWPSCYMWLADTDFVKTVISSTREFPPSSMWLRKR